MQTVKRIGWFLWKLLVGGTFCQFGLTAILAIGWTYRLMQRTALKRWWAMSADPGKGADFKSWAEESPAAHPHVHFPNWFFQPGGLTALREDWSSATGFQDRFHTLRHGLVGSLWRNLVLGVQGIANIWVLTILPVMLWQFGWYSGWDNSFNKGYEQYYVGIALSWIGILLFLLVMLYIPMAQARQAVTGEWRAFYQFRTVWGIVKRRRLANLLLAVCYSLISLPIAFFRFLPFAFPQINPAIDTMSSAELIELLNRYYFWTSVAGFAAYVLLRILAARIYAGAMVEAFQKGAISIAHLGDLEGRALLELGLVSKDEQRHRNIAIEIVTRATRPAWAAAMVFATLAVWFTFVAQIYVTQFLNYNANRGYLNQPLIQLPWFRYVPDHLIEAAKEESAKPHPEPVNEFAASQPVPSSDSPTAPKTDASP